MINLINFWYLKLVVIVTDCRCKVDFVRIFLHMFRLFQKSHNSSHTPPIQIFTHFRLGTLFFPCTHLKFILYTIRNIFYIIKMEYSRVSLTPRISGTPRDLPTRCPVNRSAPLTITRLNCIWKTEYIPRYAYQKFIHR